MTLSVALRHLALGQGETLIILHGLLGSGRNWRTIGRKLADQYQVLLPDARNHGRSPHAEDMSYPAQAGDVLHLLDTLEETKVHLLGHSMGGKTAMFLSYLAPTRIASLTVVDIAPVSYPDNLENEQRQLMQAMLELDLNQLKNRTQANHLLAKQIENPALRAFALLGLEPIEGKWRWQSNLEKLCDSLALLREFPVLEAPLYGGPTHFIYAANTHYVLPHYHERLRTLFPYLTLTEIADAGHWLHIEQPTRFLAALQSFLAKV